MKLSEKYRPKTLDDIIGQDDNIKKIRGILESDGTANFLFYGPAGTGKTSTAKAIANDFDFELFDFNASDERGIDFIRNKVKEISQTGSINGKYKLLFLDEADNLSRDAQPALRRIMEDYFKNNIFILSVNDRGGVIEPLISRCVEFNFKKLSKENMGKIVDIVASGEGLTINDETRTKIYNIANGDGRKVMELIKTIAIGSKIEYEDGFNLNYYLDQLKAGDYIKSMGVIKYYRFKDIAESLVTYFAEKEMWEEIIKIGDWILPNPQPDDYIGKAGLTAYLIKRKDKLGGN